MNQEELKDFDDLEQKLIKEFLESESLELDEIDSIESRLMYDLDCLEIEIGNQEYYIILDDTKLEDKLLDFMRDSGSEYPYFYTESIKEGRVDPVNTCFNDWIQEIIDYDGWESVVGTYDGSSNELTGNAVYFRRN